ncbi:hypothetical protein ACFP63_08645 [Oerskovia jenensis]|uniref:Uncharacterized protein n=1 Tax=Oerskovia jenensis TaxID=162169 RepID=A0ABS2LJQ9_9CELL|nr:hypothetical protein [Oerskovia jenensis]MBM7480119.1 hypothetical protein [Oerskovia jenensis]
MNENQSTDSTPADFDILDWIQSGTIARREVPIYNDPRLVEEYEAVEARLAEAGWVETDAAPRSRDDDRSEATLGDTHTDEIAELLAQRDDIAARWEQSKSLWTVRAVSQDEVDASFDVVPVPKQPLPPKQFDAAPDSVREAFLEKARLAQQAAAQAAEDRKLAVIATAVVSIVTAKGTAEGITLDALKTLRSRPHGKQWIDRLYDAVNAATSTDTELPRPTSNGRSANVQA